MTEKKRVLEEDGEDDNLEVLMHKKSRAEKSSDDETSPLLELPLELFCHVRSFLSVRDRARLDSTCKTIFEYLTPEQREEAKQVCFEFHSSRCLRYVPYQTVSHSHSTSIEGMAVDQRTSNNGSISKV